MFFTFQSPLYKENPVKRTVTFRKYTWPGQDGERGEFLESFTRDIEGKTLAEISANAMGFAEENSSQERDEEVHVYEIPHIQV